RNLRLFLFLAFTAFALFILPSIGFAQNPAQAVFNETTTVHDQNIVNGLAAFLWWVYLGFRIVAIVVVGWSMLEIRNGELTKGFFGILAAIGLFFTPAFVNLAKKMGAAASISG